MIKTIKKTKLLTGLTVKEQIFTEDGEYFYLVDILNNKEIIYFFEKKLLKKEARKLLNNGEQK